MNTEIGIYNIHHHNDDKEFETRGIWEEAGFMPPQFYMQIIECLHITYLNEANIPDFYLEMIFDIVNSHLNNCSFKINDRKKMLNFAESLGIDDLKGDDDLIATMITLNIISDYFPPDGTSIPTKTTIFSNIEKMRENLL